MDSKFERGDEYKKGRKEAYNHALDVVKAELKNMRNEIIQSKSNSKDYLDGYISAISTLE